MDRDERRTDPGWVLSRRDVLTTLNPLSGVRRVRTRRAVAMGDGLQMLRAIFVGCLILTVIGTVVFAILLRGDGEARGVGWCALGAAAVGAFALVWASHAAPLACTDAGAMFDSYTSRFFLRLGTAWVAVLASLWAANIARSVVPIAAGALFGGLCFWRAAPTHGNLVADQRVLERGECRLSVIESLRFPDVDEAWGRR